MQTTPDDCQQRASECGLTAATTYTYVAGQSCDVQTVCQNFKVGCCVPTVQLNIQCANPDQTTGCINWCTLTTSGAVQDPIDSNSCNELANCAGKIVNP
ncbi:MAG: hypothetical protein V1916_00950 [Patescibacteria group bacterium]